MATKKRRRADKLFVADSSPINTLVTKYADYSVVVACSDGRSVLCVPRRTREDVVAMLSSAIHDMGQRATATPLTPLERRMSAWLMVAFDEWTDARPACALAETR